VRYGKKVYSPLSARGDVDILIAFERLEVLRYLDYIRPDGRVIMSEQELYPPSVNLGEADYPERVADTVRRWTPHVQEVNAVQIARDAGNSKAENTAMLGALSVWLGFAEEIWDAVFREAFPAKVLEANLKAFSQGQKASNLYAVSG
jgi:indolepyruvate ferredoxin oxidoreductase beta subunit